MASYDTDEIKAWFADFDTLEHAIEVALARCQVKASRREHYRRFALVLSGVLRTQAEMEEAKQ